MLVSYAIAGDGKLGNIYMERLFITALLTAAFMSTSALAEESQPLGGDTWTEIGAYNIRSRDLAGTAHDQILELKAHLAGSIIIP